MSAEDIVRDALANLADGHVFADVAKQGVPPPWIVYQVAGGEIAADLSGRPFDEYLARVQIAVWHATPEGRSSLMQQVVRAVICPEVGAVPLGAPANIFEHETRLFGSRVEVSVWSDL
ncbi:MULTISPECIES: DUF3168 domain-containing protein [unclassified Caballeronia]|uniref:tail completion protein gp17 n=1 Tax=unclassified Caballeronia TaxID=2646786 RepID=UPI0028648441|nr:MULTISPECIES: DUF3168 domain-containing protein [unclassified Caballeronia]MDR5777301.1 DUF3168 domain-containing protein [Caballeronia sp. LZ002]MDR5802565.1 DUF3168 domain-containing protein [Caballeronia sp. LZ001]MDR5852739.1 DUF3168 domain-containing protein [Caballeronia sp. LZ003]